MSTATQTTPITVQVVMADFDDVEPYRIARDVPLAEFTPLTHADFNPRGNTPLRDATGKFIAHLAEVQGEGKVTVGILLDRSYSMNPLRESVITGVNEFVAGLAEVKTVDPATSGKVLAVILTDGQENCSKEVSEEGLAEGIAAKEKDGWTFIYLGANQDAWDTGQSYGFSGKASGQVANFAATPSGTASALRSASSDAVGYLGDNDSYVARRSSGSSMRSITEDGAESLANLSSDAAKMMKAAQTSQPVDPKRETTSTSDARKQASDYLKGS